MARFLTSPRDEALVVRGVHPGEAGALSVDLSGGVRLEIFPDNSGTGEHWRLFRPGTEETHLVCRGDEIAFE